MQMRLLVFVVVVGVREFSILIILSSSFALVSV